MKINCEHRFTSKTLADSVVACGTCRKGFCNSTGIKGRKTTIGSLPHPAPECRPLSAANAASRRSSCSSSKVEFDSKVAAEKCKMQDLEKYNSAEQYPYYCPKCHNYHLTSYADNGDILWCARVSSGKGRREACGPPAPVAAPAAPAGESEGTGSVPHVPRRRLTGGLVVRAESRGTYALPMA